MCIFFGCSKYKESRICNSRIGNKVDIQNVINNEQVVGFDAVLAPTKANKHFLIKNDFEKREFTQQGMCAYNNFNFFT